MLDAISTALAGADLEAALRRVGPTNDMLPRRADDRVAGRIGSRFVAALRDQLDKGLYRPSQGYPVFVPKSRFATRPAMLMTLEDRIVLEAIVEPMRPKIERYLVSPEVVLWPRGITVDKRWDEFEKAPAGEGGGYVVLADVTGFYESIDHERLGAELVKAGVSRSQANALEAFPGEIMGARRGLPQGIVTSDSLATLYLAESDHVVRRTGLPYVRHGDDIRISVTTWPQAREALHTVETALRAAGLLLNASKVRVLKFATYSGHLRDLEKTKDEFTAKMEKARDEAIESGEWADLMDPEEADAIREALNWADYRGDGDIDKLIAELRVRLAPSVNEVVEEVFLDAMKRRPDKVGGLGKDIWHARLLWCLRRLAAVKSTVAIAHASELMLFYPEETQNICNYLFAVVGSSRKAVVSAAEFPLNRAGFLLGWQRSWLYRVLSRAAADVSSDTIEAAKSIMRTEGDWLARIEAARLIARRGAFTGADANNLLRNAPPAFRTEVIAVAAEGEGNPPWLGAFLDGARQSALNAVVLDAQKAHSQPD